MQRWLKLLIHNDFTLRTRHNRRHLSEGSDLTKSLLHVHQDSHNGAWNIKTVCLDVNGGARPLTHISLQPHSPILWKESMRRQIVSCDLAGVAKYIKTKTEKSRRSMQLIDGVAGCSCNKPLHAWGWRGSPLFFVFVLFAGAICDQACANSHSDASWSVNNVAGPCDRRAAVGCGEEWGRVSRLETTPLWYSQSRNEDLCVKKLKTGLCQC